MRQELMLLAFALFFVMSVASAQTTQPYSSTSPPSGVVTCTQLTTQTTQINNAINAGVGLGILALLFSVCLVAIGYMISKILPASGLRGWIDTEIVEITKTAILLGAIYAILSLLGSVSLLLNGTTPGTSSSTSYAGNIGTLASNANTYLCTVQNNLAFGYTFIINLANDIGLLQSTRIYYTVAIPAIIIGLKSTVAFNPVASQLLYSGLIQTPLSSVISDIGTFVAVPVIYITTLESFLLPYLVAIGLGGLIPMGLVFRAFPFIRGIGGMLIAIGIGIAIIFPATIVILNQSVSNAMGTALLSIQAPTQINTGNNFWLSVFIDTINQFFSNLIEWVAAWGVAFQSFVGIYGVLNSLIGYDIYMVVQFLLFILDLAIVVPIVNGIAASLGGSVRLGFGHKLKLV